MLSMTGFGLAEAMLGEGRLTLELRALNHRHQDVRVRLPPVLAEHSFFLEQLARNRLGRGRYDISVRAEGCIGRQPELALDRAEEVLRALLGLRDRVAPEAGLSVDALLALPDVVVTVGPEPSAVQEALGLALDRAMENLVQMREAEGRTLQRDLKQRLETLRTFLDDLRQGSLDLVQHQRERLSQRISQVLSGLEHHLEPTRLEQEIALVADKSDITEELVRFSSHLDQFAEMLTADRPVGRQMDFLLQEIGREVNTIGSKCQHAPLAHLVVSAKAEVERLREQVQNVE